MRDFYSRYLVLMAPCFVHLHSPRTQFSKQVNFGIRKVSYSIFRYGISLHLHPLRIAIKDGQRIEHKDWVNELKNWDAKESHIISKRDVLWPTRFMSWSFLYFIIIKLSFGVTINNRVSFFSVSPSVFPTLISTMIRSSVFWGLRCDHLTTAGNYHRRNQEAETGGGVIHSTIQHVWKRDV